MKVSHDGSPDDSRERAARVRTLFGEIAHRYDLLNHLLSLNVDRRWRRRAVDALGWESRPEGVYLDACAGTLDMAIELAGRRGFGGRVVGADFALPMLAKGTGKIGGAEVSPLCADAERLPFPDDAFAGAVVGFGVRNLARLPKGLEELHRVVEPGGRLVILEFTVPPGRLVRWVYHAYFHRVLPLVGRLVSGHPWAYDYLPESVGGFPPARELAAMLRRCGFARVRWRLLSAGIAAIHVATKGEPGASGTTAPGP